MREVPVADRAGRLGERVGERTLRVLPRDEWERFVKRIAEAGVDVPDTVRIVGGREGRDGEHEVVAHAVGGRGIRPVHTAEIRYDQAREANRYVGTVQSRHEVDQAFRVGGKVVQRKVDVGQFVHGETGAQRGREHVDAGLGGERVHVGAMQPEERLDRRRFGVELQPLQIRGLVVLVHGRRLCTHCCGLCSAEHSWVGAAHLRARDRTVAGYSERRFSRASSWSRSATGRRSPNWA